MSRVRPLTEVSQISRAFQFRLPRSLHSTVMDGVPAEPPFVFVVGFGEERVLADLFEAVVAHAEAVGGFELQ